MKRFSFFCLGILLFASTAAAGSHKMDLMLQGLSHGASPAKAMLGKSVAMSVEPRWNLIGKSLGSVELVQVLVKTTDPQTTKASIESAGGKVSTVAGKILVAKVPTTFLDTLSEQDEVVFVEASKRLRRKMDTARIVTHADEVQAGLGNGISSLTGNDVILGFVDDSFDYGNEDFAGAGGTRVQYVKQQGADSFKLCAKDQIDSGDCSVTDGGQGRFHGTHVVGVAASSDDTYTGIAPGADIFFVFNSMDGDALANPSAPTDSIDTFSGAVLDGVADIFAGADKLDKAAVVNLSLGTSLGAHDDSSLLEQALDALLEDDQGHQLPGRAIVNAAGNENVNPNFVLESIGGIHASIDVGGFAEPSGWRFLVLDTGIASVGGAIADIWFKEGNDCTVEARAYRGGHASDTNDTQFMVGPLSITETNVSGDDVGHDNNAWLQLVTDSKDPNNNRPHAVMTLTKDPSASWSDIVSNGSNGYLFDIVVRAATEDCKGDIWLYPDQTSIVGFFDDAVAGFPIDGDLQSHYQLKAGDSNKTTTIPGTASSVITVGSYMQSKPEVGSNVSKWTDINHDEHFQTDTTGTAGSTGSEIGKVSLFSSLGPTGEITNARTKPDVVAPGEPIMSTMARNASVDANVQVDDNHFKLAGTSMAAPHVSGIIALMFQRNNTLTANEVKAVLQATATPLDDEGSNTQGAGLVDAKKAINAIAADTSAYNGTRDTNSDDLGEDGFNNFDGAGAGGNEEKDLIGGCSLIIPHKRAE